MILIVEDELQLSSSLERMFRFAGHDTVTAPTALEALSLMGVRKPDLIIVDLNLPAMDGLMFLRAVRSDRGFANVPVVIYTSDFSQAKQSEAMSLGAQDYIIKGTVGWESLLKRIERLLAERVHPRLRMTD